MPVFTFTGTDSQGKRIAGERLALARNSPPGTACVHETSAKINITIFRHGPTNRRLNFLPKH